MYTYTLKPLGERNDKWWQNIVKRKTLAFERISHTYTMVERGISIYRHNKEFSLISDFTNCGNLCEFLLIFLGWSIHTGLTNVNVKKVIFTHWMFAQEFLSLLTVKYSLFFAKKKNWRIAIIASEGDEEGERDSLRKNVNRLKSLAMGW
jgi:hypothetical protein